MKEIIAKSFTPIYDEAEDRIKLVINYQDYNNRVDLMITRRFIIKLIPSLEEFYDLYYGSDIELENNNLSSNGLFSDTQYEDLSLYQKKGVLLNEVNIKFNNLLTIIEFKTNLIVVSSTFNKQMLKAFISNLKNSIPKFNWGINF